MSPYTTTQGGLTPITNSFGVPTPPGRDGHSEILLPVDVEELLLWLQDHLKAWEHWGGDTQWTQASRTGTRDPGVRAPPPTLPYSLTSNWVLKTCSGESSNLAIIVHVPRLEKAGDRVRGQVWRHGYPWATLGGGTHLMTSGSLWLREKMPVFVGEDTGTCLMMTLSGV